MPESARTSVENVPVADVSVQSPVKNPEPRREYAERRVCCAEAEGPQTAMSSAVVTARAKIRRNAEVNVTRET
jgi:hypothetical protein